MIYLDNAATGGFKPRSVTDSALNVTRYLLANPGRSGHRLAVTGATLLYNTRKTLGEFFSCPLERVVFTKNCTEALNTAIFGMINKDDHVITTIYEHNSVLRPLYHLERLGLITLSIVDGDDDIDFLNAVSGAINKQTKAIVCTAVSNVTGRVLPIKSLGEIAQKNSLLFIVDGAQGGGHIPLNLKEDNISALAIAGHKGLYGIMGSGALLLSDGVLVNPLTYGGTGIDSFNQDQPEDFPERLEAGTLNLPAVASLYEGVNYIAKNLSSFATHLNSITAFIIDKLRSINGVTCHSSPNPVGIVSFALDNLDSIEVSDILSNEFDIAVRGGFHCAPLYHKHLKTDKVGLVRASISPQNSSYEVLEFLQAVKKIASR